MANEENFTIKITNLANPENPDDVYHIFPSDKIINKPKSNKHRDKVNNSNATVNFIMSGYVLTIYIMYQISVISCLAYMLWYYWDTVSYDYMTQPTDSCLVLIWCIILEVFDLFLRIYESVKSITWSEKNEDESNIGYWLLYALHKTFTLIWIILAYYISMSSDNTYIKIILICIASFRLILFVGIVISLKCPSLFQKIKN